jgi:hypothetical protein
LFDRSVSNRRSRRFDDRAAFWRFPFRPSARVRSPERRVKYSRLDHGLWELRPTVGAGRDS